MPEYIGIMKVLPTILNIIVRRYVHNEEG